MMTDSTSSTHTAACNNKDGKDTVDIADSTNKANIDTAINNKMVTVDEAISTVSFPSLLLQAAVTIIRNNTRSIDFISIFIRF